MIELMRDRITIQKSSVKTDKIGNHAAVWEDVYSCAAYANNLSGKEYWAAKQLNAQSELDFIIPVSYTHLDVYKRQGEQRYMDVLPTGSRLPSYLMLRWTWWTSVQH